MSGQVCPSLGAVQRDGPGRDVRAGTVGVAPGRDLESGYGDPAGHVVGKGAVAGVAGEHGDDADAVLDGRRAGQIGEENRPADVEAQVRGWRSRSR